MVKVFIYSDTLAIRIISTNIIIYNIIVVMTTTYIISKIL